MLNEQEANFSQYLSPKAVENLLYYAWDQQETYNDHVETLRRLLVFVENKTSNDPALWEIKEKHTVKFKKHLQKLDDLIVKVKRYT